jgi:hypothetical protein
MRRLLIALVSLSIAGCTAISQQKAQPPKADNLQFKNLKVLSPTLTRDELIGTMRTYARSLGTRCEHCHVQTIVDGKEQNDFPSDAKPEKNVARQMIRMTLALNRDYVSKVNEHGQSVTCATCHRGHTVPEQWTPPPPQPRPDAEHAAPPPPPPTPAPVN